MQVAFLDGVEVIAFELSEEDFAQLKVRRRSNPDILRFSDGLEAIPRSGKSVGAHFAHKSGQGGTTEPETIHHVHAKRVVREVARRRGWDAQIEARHPEGVWQADILLTRDARKVAFEVQWSPQTMEDYTFRTERYAASGVEVVWLAKYSRRTWWDIERAVPALPFQADGVGTYKTRPLEEVVEACLAHLESALQIPADAPAVLMTDCYRCGKPFGYRPSGPPGPIEVRALWGDKEPLGPAEVRVLGQSAARLKVTYSRTAGAAYPAWHCPHCGAMQGDFYLKGTRFAIVEDQLVPDTRGRSLWEQLEEAAQELEDDVQEVFDLD